MKLPKVSALAVATMSIALYGCGGGSSSNDDDNVTTPVVPESSYNVPETYTFTDASGNDTVSYSGQTARHILISDLKAATADVTDTTETAAFDYFFRFDSEANGDNAFDFAIDGQTLVQDTYNSISSGKDLISKIAGQDKAEHVLGEGFFGWGDVASPTDLVDQFFDDLVLNADTGFTIATTASDTTAVEVAYVSPEGLDYVQLIQKFLLGAVTFSQGTADYLQTDFADASNLALVDGKNYTAAEHKWDEAFGYFGATRNFNDFTDDEIAIKGGRPEFQGYNDANGDGLLDLRSEVIFGNSANCAKRDRGATVETDLTKEAFDAFLTGRAIIAEASAAGELTSEAAADLESQIQIAAVTWEKCIAATVIHYINDTIADMDDFDGTKFADVANFTDLAKHWGEMKGFALGLQFNPLSPFRVSEAAVANLEEVHSLMGDAPVLADGTQAGEAFTGGVSQYRTDLLAARDLLRDAYGFHADNAANW
ncbi:DUF4856 domain-containing protein [uncultured Thalassolituus sp.]|uniref:DUF4856 domain-containing protein n=1 Tax=uncultured Thalassolituus sp. TaxID=285273 RepID=UPI002639BA03|nr:DUF4856 domain-containing protein [uncultured Thalassolituus sp.]